MKVNQESLTQNIQFQQSQPAVDAVVIPNLLQQDYATCRRIMLAASKNYSFASIFLSSEVRPYVESVYALVRVGDDRVDVTHQGFDSARSAIEEWQAAYWQAFDKGDYPHLVFRAYLHTALTFGVPAHTMAPYFQAMIEDPSTTRYATFGELLH